MGRSRAAGRIITGVKLGIKEKRQEKGKGIAKRTRKKNEWWDKECEQLKKQAVEALRELRKTKSNRNSFEQAKWRERTEKERGGG
jgi:hypothetical protein